MLRHQVTRTPADADSAGLPTPPPSHSGLMSSEAAALLARHGPNHLVAARRRTLVPRWLWRAVTDPMALLLMIATPTYFLIGDTTDGLITLAALVPVAGVGWLLEARAERALESLGALTAPTVVVWRDARHQVISTADLVPGDLVVIREGDVIAADGRVVGGSQLMVDESALTGESQPISKTTDADDTGAGDTGAGDTGGSEVFAGTTVLSGRGLARVTVTGTATRYGAIGTLMASIAQPPTPLQRAVGKLVRYLGVGAALFCMLVVGVELARGNGWGASIIAGVSLAIAAIPEEFPMVYTLYLGLGAWRLAREHALVRRLSGVETLGSTTVICSDKTGTLTLGQLAVSALALADGTRPGDDDPRVADLLTAAVLACEPEPFDPLERAIVDHAARVGIDVDSLHGGVLIDDHPFDPSGKYLSHVWRHDDRTIIAAKGAVETLIGLGDIEADAAAKVLAANDVMAATGLRVLAVASGPLATVSGDRARDEAKLIVQGLIAFSDPLRPGVRDSLAQCAAAGIRVVMITGDHQVTARAVADGLGLPHQSATGDDDIATGEDVDAADDDALDELVGRVNVFARTRPEQKHRLVRALHDRGEVVAMTGDGINDAPALREADIGVAMGQRGTDVAREAATMVLLDDNFATIVSAVRNGRRIFDNLLRAFAYLIAFHPPLLLAALIVPLTGRPLLLLPVHLVLLELVVHPVVSLVFENDPPDADLMARPPRPAGRGLLNRDLLRPLMLGLTLAVAVLVVYLVALSRGLVDDHARGLAFTTLLLGQALLILVVRSPDRAVWRQPLTSNPTLLPVVAGVVAIAVVAVQVRPLAEILRLHSLGVVDWLVALVVAIGATCWSFPHRRSPLASQ